MDLFAANTALAVISYVVVAIGLVAALVSLGVIVAFLVRNRKARLARHESIGSYYRGLALSR
jgi:hypothetical protein